MNRFMYLCNGFVVLSWFSGGLLGLIAVLRATLVSSGMRGTDWLLVGIAVWLICFQPALGTFLALLCVRSSGTASSRYPEYHRVKKGQEDLGEVDRIPIVYREEYNIALGGLERLHPFDSQKYGRIYDILVTNEIIRSPNRIYRPRMVTMDELLLVHSRMYLCKVLHSSFVLTRILEVPLCCCPMPLVRHKVLNPMLYATGGTVLAGNLALEHGWAINLAGGYHHAGPRDGSGFCVFSDVAIAIKQLKRDYPERLKRFLIVDCDAHQGNGTERAFLQDSDVFILDVYNPNVFPRDEYAKQAVSCEVHVSIVDSDEEYLSKLSSYLSRSVSEFNPDMIFYNAGTDCLAGDPLGGLNLSPQGIISRDEIVFAGAMNREPHIPIAMVLSGGYQVSNAGLVAESIINLNYKFSLTSRED